jgi:hypothetical protein
MNTNDTKPNKPTIQSNQIDPRVLSFLNSLDSETQRRLASFAIEILACHANGAEDVLRYEIETERECAGLDQFCEDNEDVLRNFRSEPV